MASVQTHTTTKGERRYTVRYRDPARKQRRRPSGAKSTPTVSATGSRQTWMLAPTSTRVPGRHPQPPRETLAHDTQRQGSVDAGSRQVLLQLDDPSHVRAPSCCLDHPVGGRDRGREAQSRTEHPRRSPATSPFGSRSTRRDRIIATNPAADVESPTMKPRRTPRVLSDDELQQVIDAAEEVDERTAIVIHLAARCGLHAGEALALRRRDVNLDGATIAVRTSMPRTGPRGP